MPALQQQEAILTMKANMRAVNWAIPKSSLPFVMLLPDSSYALLPQLSMSGEYIFGGYDRYDDKQRNLAVFALSYDF